MNTRGVTYKIEILERLNAVKRKFDKFLDGNTSKFGKLNKRIAESQKPMMKLAAQSKKISARGVDKLYRAVDGLPKDVRAVSREFDLLYDRTAHKMQRLSMKLQKNFRDISKGSQRMNAKGGRAGKAGGSGMAGGMGMLKGAGAAGLGIAAVASTQRLFSMASNSQRAMTDTLAEFERYEAVLSNSLGSDSAAQQVMRQISDFATKTPFQVGELTDSWVRLTNQGFSPNMKEMMKLSDIAASTGKDFTQLSEAILDAKTFEFERLKEFGIRAKKDGDKIKFTFKGQETQVAATDDAIQKYLLSLGDLEGVQGASSKIMATTGGMMSNLNDKLIYFRKRMGDALKPVIQAKLQVKGLVLDSLMGLADWLQSNQALVQRWADKMKAGAVKAIAAFQGVVYKVREWFFVHREKISAVMGWVRMLTGWIQDYYRFNVQVWKGAGQVLSRYVHFLYEKGKDIGQWIAAKIQWFRELRDKIIGFFSNIKDGIADMVQKLKDSTLGKIIMKLVDLATKAREMIGGIGSGAVDQIKKTAAKLNPFRPLIKGVKSLYHEEKELYGQRQEEISRQKDLFAAQEKTRKANLKLAMQQKAYDPIAGSTSSPATDSRSSTNPIKTFTNNLAGAAGGAIKHININITKLVEHLNVHSVDGSLSPGVIKREMEKVLIAAVNEVNYDMR